MAKDTNDAPEPDLVIHGMLDRNYVAVPGGLTPRKFEPKNMPIEQVNDLMLKVQVEPRDLEHSNLLPQAFITDNGIAAARAAVGKSHKFDKRNDKEFVVEALLPRKDRSRWVRLPSMHGISLNDIELDEDKGTLQPMATLKFMLKGLPLEFGSEPFLVKDVIDIRFVKKNKSELKREEAYDLAAQSEVPVADGQTNVKEFDGSEGGEEE